MNLQEIDKVTKVRFQLAEQCDWILPTCNPDRLLDFMGADSIDELSPDEVGAAIADAVNNGDLEPLSGVGMIKAMITSGKIQDIPFLTSFGEDAMVAYNDNIEQ